MVLLAWLRGMIQQIKLFWLIQASLQTADIRIPLSASADGRYIAIIAIPSASLDQIPASISISDTTSIFTQTRLETERVLHESEIDSTTDLIRFIDPFVDFYFGMDAPEFEINSTTDLVRFIDTTVEFHIGVGSSVLGIGPSSALVTSIGPVSIIRTGESSADLILNSNAESFAQRCTIRDIIVAVILASGAVFNRYDFYDNSMFSNCSGTSIAALPAIGMKLSSLDGIEMGRVLYYPEDFFEFDGAGGCKLSIVGRDPSWYDAELFDPLMITRANVRISQNNTIEICDSVI